MNKRAKADAKRARREQRKQDGGLIQSPEIDEDNELEMDEDGQADASADSRTDDVPPGEDGAPNNAASPRRVDSDTQAGSSGASPE